MLIPPREEMEKPGPSRLLRLLPFVLISELLRDVVAGL